jgi:hypothetical protein
MKRDIDLQRKILFAIEEQYKPGEGQIFNLKIDGYDLDTVAEHCSLLYKQGLITSDTPQWADDRIYFFTVGNLSPQGYDFLELVRSDEIWDKTKEEVEEKKLPATIKILAEVAAVFSAKFFKELNT